MAGRIFDNVQALNKQVKLLHAKMSFAVGVPTLANTLAFASASRTAAGQLTCAFNDSFPSFLGVDAVLVSTTAKDFKLQIKSVDIVNKSVVFFTLVDGVATDLVAGDEVYFIIHAKNTSV